MQLLRAVWSFGSSIAEMVHLWKIYCVSVLEQSCVVWGSSLTQENIEDLERTQKTFAKLILRDKYVDYESALQKLNLETLAQRRKELALRFAKSSIENHKLDEFFIRKNSKNIVKIRKPAPYRTTKAHTESFRKSSIIHMQELLNNEITQ